MTLAFNGLMAEQQISMRDGFEATLEGSLLARTLHETHPPDCGDACEKTECVAYEVWKVASLVTSRGEAATAHAADYAVVQRYSESRDPASVRAYHTEQDLDAWLLRLADREPNVAAKLRTQMAAAS